MRYLLSTLLTVVLLSGGELSAPEKSLLTPIAADTIKGHVSFLASDAMEGRDTPSRGLEIAGEYIASQFRRFGLEPAGDEGYFQNAPYIQVTQPMDQFQVTLDAGGKVWKAVPASVMLTSATAVSLAGADVVKVSLPDENAPLPARELVEGKAVILVAPGRTRAMMTRRDAVLALGPSVVVMAGFVFSSGPRLMESRVEGAPRRAPLVVTSDPDFAKFVTDLPEGATPAKLTAKLQAAVDQPIKLKNVIAKLPGSDPKLADSYILLTAHYDHVGVSSRGEGDRINNGANDDASGVATVLSLAEAFARLPQRPKRTIVFMTYFGEEKGLFGSRYYASHPVFPLAKTIANLNFEHMGRTDDNEGPRVGKITASGFDYTTLGDVLTEAGLVTGVEAWKHEKNSDLFFARSDNQALADAGVPALTVAVAWIFPDYHRPGDEWAKLDYANMEKVLRTCAVTVSRIANDEKAPAWVESNPKVDKYVKAWKALHAGH
ncbi:MAG: M20/M25/M40 family metallo-hydrolase [Bryobacterales bacterium]|nr:M20/M25/M40 family metallo-hydrolase [Bryobacterales bacterium]